MVLITLYYGKSAKRSHYNNVVENVPIIFTETDSLLKKTDWTNLQVSSQEKDHSYGNNLSWIICKKASPYYCGSKRCNLCSLEKVSIIRAESDTLLNKTIELMN